MEITIKDFGETVKVEGIGLKSYENIKWGLSIALAISLWRTSKDLDEQIPKSNLKRHISDIIGNTISSIILKSLSIEILLKFFSYKSRKGFIETHNLQILYNDLDGNTKKTIEDISKEQGIQSIEKIIESHKADFTNWRYSFEGKSLPFNDLEELDSIINILSLTEKRIYNTKFDLDETPAPLTYPS